MSGKSKKKEKQASSIIDQLQSDPFFQFHRNYWQFDENEKEQLMSKYPTDLFGTCFFRKRKSTVWG